MHNGEKLNFKQLLSSYNIVIPKIQRDYIQGRSNGRVENNRKKFVKNLTDFITDGEADKEFSLNFIYGIIEGDTFIPIDGQQRLTTLFLLYLYVYEKARVDCRSLFKKFSYDTRYTTARFFKNLIVNIGELIRNSDGLKDEETLSGNIHSQWWYYSLWENDINIRSCLAVLDNIHQNLKDREVDCKKLDDITFMFLKLEEFGSANELYIKMNSRGKQLTDFENFKAELYEKADVPEFKEGLDGKWAELVYGICEKDYKRAYKSINKKGSETPLELIIKDADNFTKDLFHWVFVNRYYADSWGYFDREDNNLVCSEEKFGTTGEYGDNSGDFWFDTYYTIAGSVENVEIVISDYSHLFKLLCEIENDKELFDNVCEKMLGVYSVRSFRKKKSIVYDSGKMTYDARILLYAVTAYANNVFSKNNAEKIDGINIENFKSWFRVILNLVNNTETDSIGKFKNAVQAISRCVVNFEDIGNVIASGADFIEYFDSSQREEEIEKLDLINDEKWKQAIYAAEGWYEGTEFVFEKKGVDYFGGQIYFLLHMANKDVDKFNDYCRKVFKIFSDKDEYDMPFHRAILTYGDYKTGKKRGIYTFFSNYDRHHDYDWRGAFKKNDGWRDILGYLQNLLDDWDGVNFKDFANKRIENYTATGNVLIDNLIINKEIKTLGIGIFDYIGKGCFYVEDCGDGDWILMSHSRKDKDSYMNLSEVSEEKQKG